jgi:pimeloyl-ACP methyl ester carboxylesterase
VKQSLLPVQYKGSSLTVAACIKEASHTWLICLHGLQSNKELFEGLLSQGKFRDLSVVALDFIGFGKSDKPPDFGYDIASQALIVSQIVGMLQIKNLKIIGHSLGGMVGVLLLEPLKGVISAFANLEGNLVLSDCGVSKTVVQSSFEVFASGGYAELKKQIAQQSRQRSVWLEDVPDYAFYETSRSIVQWCKSEKLPDLFAAGTCERLFVYGDQNSLKAQAVPKGIELRQISNSGHFMLLDNAYETYDCLSDFLLTGG